MKPAAPEKCSGCGAEHESGIYLGMLESQLQKLRKAKRLQRRKLIRVSIANDNL